jgi:hypothetical protein
MVIYHTSGRGAYKVEDSVSKDIEPYKIGTDE